MADIKFNFNSAFKALDALGAAEARNSLARTMAVAGAVVFRDEAQQRAPVKSGRLRDAIYTAYADQQSRPNDGLAVYKVTWRTKTGGATFSAPHGHLIEFGHWRYNRRGEDGMWLKSLKPGRSRGRGPQDHQPPGALDEPVWVPAKPFMRPAYDAKRQDAIKVMFEAGGRRMKEIMEQIEKESAT